MVGTTVVDARNILGRILSTQQNLSRITIDNTLKYIFDTYQLAVIAKALGISCTYRYPKARLTALIVDLAMKLDEITRKPSQVNAIAELQRKWRQRCLHGNPALASNNDDPFTLTPVSDLLQQDIFAYTDERGRTWAFHAPDLYYHVRSNSPTNPFTRDSIPDKDLLRLDIIMKDRPCVQFSLESCTTVDQMYTYVLSLYDKEGFYLQNDWFKALSIRDLDVVRKVVSRHVASTSIIKSHKDFANFMLNIVTSTDPLRFPSICLLISTVSRLIPEMEHAIPDWVFTSAHAII